MSADRRLIEWIDLTADVLQLPRPEFPCVEIAWQLNRTFDVLAVSWDWRDDQGRSGSQTWPDVVVSPVAGRPYGQHQDHLDRAHPVVRWFVTTRDPGLQSIGVDQQLAIPYLLSSQGYGAFVLVRLDDDFCDDDLALARRLQRLIRGIYLHSALVERLPDPTDTCQSAARAGLTATELAVLLLLSEGHTAHAIGRRLAMSPRTAQKHLEHIYRKLGVADRLGAVLAAREGGLVPLAPAPPAGPFVPEQRTPI